MYLFAPLRRVNPPAHTAHTLQMLFYPIDYWGIDVMERPLDSPFGYFGWQGVVPTKTKTMAKRLVGIVTENLLSLPEAFGRLDPAHLATLLQPAIEVKVQEECGTYWLIALKPVLPFLLTHLLTHLQKEIETVMDLQTMTMTAFVSNKVVLVDLFQKVGRVELDFLVNSGFGFGFGLGVLQMLGWARTPHMWTLPVAGALVGYVTNWIAIKFLFDPAEPIYVGPLKIQGLFESRQVEVSDEFGAFLEQRVLNSPAILTELAKDDREGELYHFLRRHLPVPIPDHILMAAIRAIQQVARNPQAYPEVHDYITTTLDIEETLARRLKLLSPVEFEDLLHPVFQEDEITLIATGGVLGLAAGLAQTRLGWGGPGATRKAIMTIVGVLSSSAAFYFSQSYEHMLDEQVPSKTPTNVLRRRNTLLQLDESLSNRFYDEVYHNFR